MGKTSAVAAELFSFSEEKTLREILARGTALLEEARVPDASYDAWSLFSAASGLSRSRYFMHQTDSPEGKEWVKKYAELLEKRRSRIPLQHILGSAPFMEYDFLVNEHVLTPRQDTETLVETALAQLVQIDTEKKKNAEFSKTRVPVKVLDMCTGSGCIAISLYCMAAERNIPLDMTGADLSEEALKVARINNENIAGGHVRLVQSDLFRSLEVSDYDMIVSNPPYIPSAVCETLMPEVKDHEPRMALDGMEDGLHYYRLLTKECVKRLKPGGFLAFEIGYDQGKTVSDMMVDQGYVNVKIIQDLAGLDRVVTGYMPDY